jgi:uncharacterized protein
MRRFRRRWKSGAAMTIRGTTLVPGTVKADVIALAEPLSFWGGFDSETGRVIDRRHPDLGACLTGKIVVMTAARGSSSGTSVLAEAIRTGTAPAAFVIAERDAILTVGAMIAAELYGRFCPIVVVTPADLAIIARATTLTLVAQLDDAKLS